MKKSIVIQMQIIADNMLGKLAKWLRFMGFDTMYPRNIDDKALVDLTRKENRCLLSRDKELSKIKNLNVIYIKSEKIEEQLKQVIKELNLKPNEGEFTRCPECNSKIINIEKIQVKDKVPPGVYNKQELFWLCKKCGRYYWQGTHYDKIKEKIKMLYDSI
jgi:uncharacterized protein with PIN domain